MPSRHSDAVVGEFHTLTDCEGVELESNVPFRFACCDCGLVHDMVIVSQDDKPVGFAIKRMPEATQERRAALGIDFEHWLYHEQTENDVDSLNKSAIELARDAFSAGLRKSLSAPGDAQDAARYRWLRARRGANNRYPHITQYPYQPNIDNEKVPQMWEGIGYKPENLDAAIDAALAAIPEPRDG